MDFRNIFAHSESELAGRNAQFAKYYAAADASAPPAEAEGGGWMVYAAASFPNACVEVVSGAGHGVFHDRPREFAAAAGRFPDSL